jgi:hypothetical protein
MYEIGTATDFNDLLDKLDTFLTATGSAFGLTYAGTGNGTLTAYKGGASSVAETFTITATSATNFTVVGSTSGSIGPATAGTPFAHAKVAFLITAGGTAFVAGDVFTLSTAPKWTLKRGVPTATSTRWRVFVITTVAGGVSTFVPRIARFEMMTTPGGADQITGGTATASSSNASHLPADAADANGSTYWESATVTSSWWEYTFGSAKTIKELAITYATGQSSDSFAPLDLRLEYFDGTVWVPAASWRNETAWQSAERRVFRVGARIWQAPGNDGTSQIFVGASPIQNAAASWYNWRLNGYTAFDASADWFQQPGAISQVDPYGPLLPLSNTSIGYWFVANGRRVMGVAKVGSSYESFYLGLIQPYMSPGQWPLPLFVGGSLWFEDEPLYSSSLWLSGTSHGRHTSFVLPFTPLYSTNANRGFQSSARLRKPDGAWRGFSARSDFYDPKETPELNGRVWPYAYGFTNLKPDLDGAYPLFPVIYFDEGPDNLWGQPDGIAAVPGSSLSPEAALTNGLENWIAFPDVTRSSAGDFFAMRMD